MASFARSDDDDDDDTMGIYMDDDDFETMGFRMDDIESMGVQQLDDDDDDIETAITRVHILDDIEALGVTITTDDVHELETSHVTTTHRATTSQKLRSYCSRSRMFGTLWFLFFVLICIRNFGSESNRLGSLLEANTECDASTILVDQQQSGSITTLLEAGALVSASQRSFALVVQDLNFLPAYNLYDMNQTTTTTTTPTLLYKVRTSFGALNFNPARDNSNAVSPVLTLKVKPWQTKLTYTILVDNQEQGMTIKRLRAFNKKVTYNIALDQNDNRGGGHHQFGYQVEGSIHGVLWMRNMDDEIVAKFSYHTTNIFFPGYLQIHVAPGMDQSLVWMCAMALFSDRLGIS